MLFNRTRLILSATLLGFVPAATAQVWDKPLSENPDAVLMDAVPLEVRGSGIIQRMDNQVPLDREFTDSRGERVKLSDIITGDLPVLLTLNYSDCPQLCDFVLTGVVGNLNQINLDPGDEYQIITLSINPNETMERGAAVKQHYIDSFKREGADQAWHFLRGTKEDVRAVANAVGFSFVEVEGTDPIEYSHPATLIVLTPQGRVSLYLTAINDDPQTVRLALVDASGGAIGNLADLFFTNCFRYDPSTGKYTPIAIRIMSIGGGVFVLGFASLLITFRVLEKRRQAEDTK